MVFVTGGTGVLGAHVLYELCLQRKPIKALKRKGSDISIVKHVFSYYTENAEDLINTIEWTEGDLLDYQSIEEAMLSVDEVYHIAAIVSFDPDAANKMKYVNRQGTANVVNAALSCKVPRFCHVSSVAAVGDSANGAFVDEKTERSKSAQHSAYSQSKFESEMEVWRGISEGLNAVIVNPSIIIAPGDWGRSSTSLFSSIDKGVKFYPSGITGYVDVRDVAKIMIRLTEKARFGERYILNAENVAYKTLFSTIARAIGKPEPNVKLSPWLLRAVQFVLSIKKTILGGQLLITPDMVRSAFKQTFYSNEKIRNELGYEFIPVEKSIAEFSVFFKQDNRQGN